MTKKCIYILKHIIDTFLSYFSQVFLICTYISLMSLMYVYMYINLFDTNHRDLNIPLCEFSDIMVGELNLQVMIYVG